MAGMPPIHLILRHGLLNRDFPWRVLHFPSNPHTLQYTRTYEYNQPDALSYEWDVWAHCKLHSHILLAVGTPALCTCEQAMIVQLPLCLINHSAMNTYKENKVQLHPFLILTRFRDERPRSRLDRFTPEEGTPVSTR